MVSSTIGVCDVCGDKATDFARDIYEVTEPMDTISRYKLDFKVKRGCDKHPVASIQSSQLNSPITVGTQ